MKLILIILFCINVALLQWMYRGKNYKVAILNSFAAGCCLMGLLYGL